MYAVDRGLSDRKGQHGGDGAGLRGVKNRNRGRKVRHLEARGSKSAPPHDLHIVGWVVLRSTNQKGATSSSSSLIGSIKGIVLSTDLSVTIRRVLLRELRL
jgi:hypothetical protein